MSIFEKISLTHPCELLVWLEQNIKIVILKVNDLCNSTSNRCFLTKCEILSEYFLFTFLLKARLKKYLMEIYFNNLFFPNNKFFCCKINVWSTVHCIIHTEATTSKIWTNNINMNYFKCKTSLPFIDKQICCLHWAAESCSCHWWIID